MSRKFILFCFALLLLCSCVDEETGTASKVPAPAFTEKKETREVKTPGELSDSVQKTEMDTPRYDSKILYFDTLITGYFNHDSILDSVSLWVPMDPKEEFDMWGCYPCITKIKFSTGQIIRHTNDVGWRLENVGDWNNDGVDEIAY
jgi:hypothetical protein